MLIGCCLEKEWWWLADGYERLYILFIHTLYTVYIYIILYNTHVRCMMFPRKRLLLLVRVRNSLFDFSCQSLVFWQKERIALSLFLKQWISLFALFAKWAQNFLSFCANRSFFDKKRVNRYFVNRESHLFFKKLKWAICSFCSSRKRIALVTLYLRVTIQ